MAIGASWTAAACEGSLGGSMQSESARGASQTPGGDPLGDASCQEQMGEQPLRRLSSIQYRNTMRSLFGELGATVTEDSLFPETTISQGFHADAEANTVNTTESHAIEDNASRIAELIDGEPQRFLSLLPCDGVSAESDASISSCIDEFIEGFGMRAYRRPLTSEEAAILKRVFDEVNQEQGALSGFAAVVQLLVQAPALLYRVERGEGEPEGGEVRLSSFEMASRLSYFLTDDMPDEELWAAAIADELQTTEQVLAQARRLIDSPAFSVTMSRFFGDWLHLYELENLPKDADVFPDFDQETREALAQETRRLLEQVLDEGDGSLSTLLSSSLLPVHPKTAPLYGVEPPEEEWGTAEISSRRGLLSQASVMAVLAEADRTSPIHRGAVFVRDVLCVDLPALPGDVDTAGPLEDTSDLPTARERLAPLLTSPSCANCHQAFNPVGFAFENYDASGAWRDTENETTIDASGTFNLGEGEFSFDGPTQLLEEVAESQAIRDCVSLQAFRAMKGRRESAEDECSVEYVRGVMEETGGDLRSMVLSLVETRAFLFRREVSQ